MELTDQFKALLIIMLFYSISITLISYALPDDSVNYVSIYNNEIIDIDQTAEDVQGSLTQQTNIPIIDLGAMVFYSGNILIDLLVNFAFAIPQMLTLLITGIFSLFNFDTELQLYIQLFFTAGAMVWYLISLMQVLTNVRSGRVV